MKVLFLGISVPNPFKSKKTETNSSQTTASRVFSTRTDQLFKAFADFKDSLTDRPLAQRENEDDTLTWKEFLKSQGGTTTASTTESN